MPKLLNNNNTVSEHQLISLKSIGDKCNKSPGDVTDIDHLIFYPINSGLFSPALELLIHQYWLKKTFYPKLIEGIKSPLDVFNDITERAKFKYKAILNGEPNPRQPAKIILIQEGTDIKINFRDLSSGEKTIMSLIFALYNSSNNGYFPEVILLDEPDAHLHPSLANTFIEVINDVIVKKNKVKVIMTTHSPSTVALAPNDSIYVMRKGVGYPEKADKSIAIKSLLSGVNGLFVSYENRRQVFVESKYDAIYYEEIYKRIFKWLNSQIHLNFVSSGETKVDNIGNCDQVEKIATLLQNNGNKYVYGIIDYDGKKNSSDAIKVLGNGNRYSIENYLFDPILLVALLLNEKIYSRQEFGLSNDESFTDLKRFSQERLQSIVDIVFTKIPLPKADNIETNRENVKLINGYLISVPKWYLQHNGHQLESHLISQFDDLKSIKRNKEDTLKKRIIINILDEMPELLSYDFVECFTSIQNQEIN